MDGLSFDHTVDLEPAEIYYSALNSLLDNWAMSASMPIHDNWTAHNEEQYEQR